MLEFAHGPCVLFATETKKPAVSLFDDDEDEDDSDIFSSKSKSSLPAASKPTENENKPKVSAQNVVFFAFWNS